jgi:hypothetical protein
MGREMIMLFRGLLRLLGLVDLNPMPRVFRKIRKTPGRRENPWGSRRSVPLVTTTASRIECRVARVTIECVTVYIEIIPEAVPKDYHNSFGRQSELATQPDEVYATKSTEHSSVRGVVTPGLSWRHQKTEETNV